MLTLTIYTTRPNSRNPERYALAFYLDGKNSAGGQIAQLWQGSARQDIARYTARQVADETEQGLCINYAQWHERPMPARLIDR